MTIFVVFRSTIIIIFGMKFILHVKNINYILFNKFYMGDNSRAAKLHYGMGLYITQNIINQHIGNSKITGGGEVLVCITDFIPKE